MSLHKNTEMFKIHLAGELIISEFNWKYECIFNKNNYKHNIAERLIECMKTGNFLFKP